MANIKIYEKEQVDRLVSPKANSADFDLAGGVPRAGYVQSLFSRDDTSKEIQNAALANAVRYPLGAAITESSTDKQLKDRISNLVTVAASDVALTLPSARSDGTLRDIILRIEMDGTTTGGSPSISDLSAWEGDELPTFAAGKNYLLTITETKASTWFVKCIELEAHTAS